MGQVKNSIKNNPKDPLKYSVYHSAKQTLKHMGNDYLNGGKGDVDYLGHTWKEDPETGMKFSEDDSTTMIRVHTIIKKALPRLRRGPVSVLEIALDSLDSLLDNYFAFAKKGTFKKILGSLAFTRKANLLYARVDQCLAVMPLWFLQLLQIAAQTVKCLKNTKLPYNLMFINDSFTYTIFEERALKALQEYQKMRNPGTKMDPLVTEKEIKDSEKPSWFWNLMLKTLLKSNVSTANRKTIRAKNRETLRLAGISQGAFERATGANRVLVHLSSAIQSQAPQGKAWAKELSGMLEARQDRYGK